MMLAVAPDRVRPDKLDRAFPDFQSDTLALELTGATIGWKTADFQPTGTWGDATGATAERGQVRLEPLIDHLAAVLTEISTFEVGNPATD